MERKKRKWSVGGSWVSGRCWEWIGGALSLFVLVLFLFFVYGIVLDVCLFDFDFSGDYVIELFGNSIATHRLSNCKSPHHEYRGIRFLRWKDNWFWSHHLQWNISCTLGVSWFRRLFVSVTASAIWNRLEREARIEAAGVCFNGCEWVFEWVSCLSYGTGTNGKCW